MSEVKKPIVMSPKGFLSKATKANVSASAFFAAHRDYMVNGELAHVLSPLVAKVENREMMPTPALIELQKVVMDHIIMSAIGTLEASVEAGESSKGTNKSWKATILNAAGEVQTRINSKGEEEDLIKGFDLAADADRWCDRILFEGASDWYATVDHNVANIHTTIMRQDSIARILAKKKGPSVHVKGMTTKSLGFGPHVKQKRVSFSHG